MIFQKDFWNQNLSQTHNIRHEKHAIDNKTDKNWKINWNNVLFSV